jgi:hypothetical protein
MNGVYVMVMLEAAVNFIHQLSEADFLTTAYDSRCAEMSKTQPASFVLATSVTEKFLTYNGMKV